MNETSEAEHKHNPMLLLAHANGARATSYRHETCTRWSDREDIDAKLGILWRLQTMKIGAVLAALSASTAFAGGIVTGKVLQVVVRASDGLVYAVLSGTPTGQPNCAKGGYWMIVNETSDVGHKQYAMLLDAQASGAQITIWGSGYCTRWGDGEDIDSMFIVSQ